MNISIVCSDPLHPFMPVLEQWAQKRGATHAVKIARRVAELDHGDLLFLISCHEIVRPETTRRFTHSLVVHASDLPRGRGWSPHIWSIVGGENVITVSLLEAAQGVDSGMIWTKEQFRLDGHELHDEINARLFETEIRLMDFALARCRDIAPQPQDEVDASYWRKRTPQDSRVDIDRSIREQFNLLRVCDPDRYPAFFEKDGFVYDITLKKRETRPEGNDDARG